jgi:alkanesulfonate monooxygenase SsuD/methylene tetrahydromethanopterin reductase-like flavin-dependent oxidoreductase (luciferase family)
MIKYFSTLYVGHIEMEHIGIDGTPADARWYPNERLIESYRMATDLARLMDRLDFYALWMAEHHFQREGYECFPNLILLSTYLATQTRQLNFGCAFNIVPMWHPLRLAEDYAVADILTDGRVIFGVGRGYHTREVETLGAPMLDNDANKELFEEQMEILFKAFRQKSFSHQGKHYTIPARVPYRGYDLTEITLVPRPIHQPVEIWQPIVSGRTLEYVARHGIKGVVGLTGEKLLDQLFQQYRDIAGRYGRTLELGQDLAWQGGFYLAKSREEAIHRLRPYHDERYKWYAPFGFVRYADAQGRPWGTPGAPARLPTLEDGVEQKVWLCGTPDSMIEALKALEAKYPALEHVWLHWPEAMPQAEYFEQLQQVAEEVMPAFRPTAQKMTAEQGALGQPLPPTGR